MTIKNLVFEGGGVKGIAYAGAIDVLSEKNLLDGVENVAGTSAGAITAALLALNFNSKEITSAINALNFKSFEDGFDPLRVLTTYGLYRGKAFLTWIQDKVEKAGLNKNATFSDLHNSDNNFKNLIVFATDLYTHNIQEFSYAKTPNTIVAEAVRASMSIPLFFKSWQFSNNQPNDHIYVDGGVLYNYPIETFDIDGFLDKETLGFFLENQTGNPINIPFGHDHIIQYVKSLFDTLLNAQKIDFAKNEDEKNRTVVINDLGISATDFGLTDQQKQDLMQQGKEAASKFLDRLNLY